MTRDQIIQAIEAHAKDRNIAPATVTSRAVGNSRLYQRLKAGGDCTTEVVARLQSFMSMPADTVHPDESSDAA